MSYIDGFVIPVPAGNKEAYHALATKAAAITDRYGVSWQIVPKALGEMLKSGDPASTRRVMGALMQMIKIDTEGLRTAARGQMSEAA